MDCEKCQNLLSDFLEGSLEGRDRLMVGIHLGGCARCRAAREEVEAIVSAAHECREHLYTPPDSRALWLRISNTIEGERAFGRAAVPTPAPMPARRRGRLASIWDRRWELTLPQMASAVAAIVVSVALVTAMATQRMMTAERSEDEAINELRTRARRQLADSVYPGAYVRQQQASISYYQQRVERRKANWNPRMRESFDRSLNVIDQAVAESLDELKQNPHDEVSEEILNAALRDKMELLRDFSEQ
ncbi:MAG TPA: zf-HC2 domain-containing protein [Pyrinomonadaceae bacterium]|nr:zf-HC2 domain-containing protein [Pyrinomonadaceae bacterium]